MQIQETNEGVYQEVGTENETLGRYTIFDESTEELDVDAKSTKHARQIAKVAWARDYTGELDIVDVVYRGRTDSGILY